MRARRAKSLEERATRFVCLGVATVPEKGGDEVTPFSGDHSPYHSLLTLVGATAGSPKAKPCMLMPEGRRAGPRTPYVP